MTNHDASQPTADSGAGDPRLHRFEDEERRPYRDPRDATNVDFDAVNNRHHYALYAVYCLVAPLPALEDTRRRLVGESNFFVDQTEVTTRWSKFLSICSMCSQPISRRVRATR